MITISVLTNALIQFVMAGLGTLAFTVMFSVPRRYYLDCSVIGGLGWLIYWFCTSRLGMSVFFPTLFASCFVCVASRIHAARRKCPATMFILSVIFPLVPGVGIYRTVYYIIMQDSYLGAQYGRMAFSVAVAIVLGILLSYELPQSFVNRIGKLRPPHGKTQR